MIEAVDVPGVLPGTSRLAYRLGSATGREHAWIVCDGDPVGGARVAWSIVEALAGSRLSRFRQLVLGRAQVTVVLPDPESLHRGPGPLAVLDSLPPATDAGVLQAFAEGPPTLLSHVHDDGVPRSRGAPASGRVVESFPIGADLHRALGEGHLARRRWYGRATPLSRILDAHPDARIGAAAASACTRSGYALRDAPAGSREPAAAGTIRIGPGRYLPSFAWRRLGATCLTEVALARFGAQGFAIQAFDGTASGRAGVALAVAEGALLARLDLDES